MTDIFPIRAPGALRILAEGHALGRPDVCAGVSALLYALAGWITDAAAAQGWDAYRWDARIGKGAASLRAPRTPEAETVFAFTLRGLAQVAAAAPEALRVHPAREQLERSKA